MVLIVLAAIHVAGVLVILFATARAPFGYEDDKGFHKTDGDAATSSETPA